MQIHNIGRKNSIFNHFIREIRDIEIQSDPIRFRKNLERIGEIFAYEISKEFSYQSKTIQTPLGNSTENLIADKPVLATILRAGLPLHQGLLNYFDHSDNAFVSAYRKHNTETDFEVKIEYLSSPDLNNRTIILCDPMLATGTSMLLGLEALLSKGKPKHIHIVGVIASKQGLDHLINNFSFKECTIWVGAIDEEMTKESYIVPGLGDAGDLAFGEKTK